MFYWFIKTTHVHYVALCLVYIIVLDLQTLEFLCPNLDGTHDIGADY